MTVFTLQDLDTYLWVAGQDAGKFKALSCPPVELTEQLRSSREITNYVMDVKDQADSGEVLTETIAERSYEMLKKIG